MEQHVIDEFWDYVDVTGPDDCWEWLGAYRGKYGVFYFEGKTWGAHRFMFLLETGIDPAELFVCHACDNPACVNVRHLWLGTAYENTSDMVSKGRQAQGKRAYKRLTEEQVQDIRKRLVLGELQKNIAKLYGVSVTTISQINRGVTWTSLPNPHLTLKFDELKAIKT